MLIVPPPLRLLLVPLASLEEPARDLVARAQAACDEDQRGAMLRAFAELHALLIPAIDALVEKQSTVSACLGMLGLWDELPDVDVERESILELVAMHAASSDSASTLPIPEGLATENEVVEAQRHWLQQILTDRALPQHLCWRRLTRRAHGPLGDRARLTVERASVCIFEHLPDPNAPSSQTATTSVGEFRTGDRLSLAVQVPLPGQLAIVHATGESQHATLDIVLPETVSEAVVRRHLEVVELHGELAAHKLADGQWAEQALIVVWVPEVTPPSWIVDMRLRHGVPPESRVWRYLYGVSE